MNRPESDRITRIRSRREDSKERRPEPAMLQYRTVDPQKEMREKGGKKGSRLNARWISGILALIFAGLIAAYAYLPCFRFSDIRITGMESLNRDEIIYFTGAQGKPIFTVQGKAIREALLRHYPEISDAEVTIELPAKMEIHLRERIPVVEWDFGGSRFWIDADGTVLSESVSRDETLHVYADSFPGSDSQEDRNLPARFSENTLRTILTIGKYAPEGRPLYFTYENGFGWDTDYGWRVFFGKSDSDLDEKMRMHESLAAYFKKNDIQPVIVSLEFKDAPYYRFME